MPLPSFIDINAILEIGSFTILVTQYIKKWLPSWAVQPAAGLITILLALAETGYNTTPFNWVHFVIIGGLSVAGAEFGYKFLNGVASGTLSQPTTTTPTK